MKNNYEIRGDVTAIFIHSKGRQYEAIIDTEDLPLVMEFQNVWSLSGGSKPMRYARGNYTFPSGKRGAVLMHRVIMKPSEEMVIDHINHSTLDNRKSNLRIVTRGENGQNVGLEGRGVTWHKGIRKWVAKVGHKRVIHSVGSFDDYEEAQEAVKKARAKLLPFSLEAHQNINHNDVEFKRRRLDMKSGVKGVTWESNCNKWGVRIKVDGKEKWYGYYDELSDAIDALNKAKSNREEMLISHLSKPKKPSKSGVRGIGWDNVRECWVVRMSVNKKQKCFGYYKELDQAKEVALSVIREHKLG